VGQTLEIQEMDGAECQRPSRDHSRGCLKWAPGSSVTAGAKMMSCPTIPGSGY